VINLVVNHAIRRGPGVLMNVSMWKHRALKSQIFLCGKDYYSNTIIITALT